MNTITVIKKGKKIKVKKKIKMTNKDIYDLPLFSTSIGINRYNIDDLLDFIIKKNPTLLKKGFLKLDDISTIRKLTNIIGENNVWI